MRSVTKMLAETAPMLADIQDWHILSFTEKDPEKQVLFRTITNRKRAVYATYMKTFFTKYE